MVRAALLLFAIPATATWAHAQSQEMEVDKAFLLWKKGLIYTTQVSAMVSLENTKFTVSAGNREEDGEGEQAKSLYYEGNMAYNTEAKFAERKNGKAERYYQMCDVGKFQSSKAVFTMPVSGWEAFWAKFKRPPLPEEWDEKLDKTETKVFGDSYIRWETKPESDHELVDMGALGGGLQELEDLSEKHLILKWSDESAFKNRIEIESAIPVESEIPGKVELVPDGRRVSPRVMDVIRRESNLLYEAVLGSGMNRKAGDVWAVDGEALAALIHPSLEGRFRGKVIVKAKNTLPTPPHPILPARIVGLRLIFVKQERVDGRVRESDLTFEMETVNGDLHTTSLMSAGSSIEGELWLDRENQCVRYGKIKSSGTRYKGNLPKIGVLNDSDVGVRIESDLRFEFEYIQAISPSKDENAK